MSGRGSGSCRVEGFVISSVETWDSDARVLRSFINFCYSNHNVGFIKATIQYFLLLPTLPPKEGQSYRRPVYNIRVRV
jgi:hypothetical protein